MNRWRYSHRTRFYAEKSRLFYAKIEEREVGKEKTIDDFYESAYNAQKQMGCALEEPFLTVEQIAKTLQVSEDFIRNLIRTKQLPAYRVGKKEYRIRREDFEEFLKKRRTIDQN